MTTPTTAWSFTPVPFFRPAPSSAAGVKRGWPTPIIGDSPPPPLSEMINYQDFGRENLSPVTSLICILMNEFFARIVPFKYRPKWSERIDACSSSPPLLKFNTGSDFKWASLIRELPVSSGLPFCFFFTVSRAFRLLWSIVLVLVVCSGLVCLGYWLLL